MFVGTTTQSEIWLEGSFKLVVCLLSVCPMLYHVVCHRMILSMCIQLTTLIKSLFGWFSFYILEHFVD